jgi:hypothetical protein
MEKQKCLICQDKADLQLSHVLPAFVFRWLKESSGGGHLRLGMEPNKRVQDGLKRYWLCNSCEGKLNTSETAFASKIFYPYLKKSGEQFRYSNWLMHFCVSLSWRVLRFYMEETQFNNWSTEDYKYIEKADKIWREVLLEKRPHPQNCQQHILPLDQLESASGKLAPSINRYLMRAVDMDLCRGGQVIFTYTKLGRFIVLGFVNEPNLKQWRGSKINANQGIIQPQKYVLPRPFWEYVNNKAKRMADLFESISDKQADKVEETFKKNIDKYVGSDAFQAMSADISMFGDNAFSKRRE